MSTAEKAARIVELLRIIEEHADRIATKNGCELETINRQRVRRYTNDGMDSLELSLATKGERGRLHRTLALDTELQALLVGGYEDAKALSELVTMEVEDACAGLVSLAAIPADIKTVTLGARCHVHPFKTVTSMDLEAWRLTCSEGCDLSRSRRHSFLVDKFATTTEGRQYLIVERPKSVRL